MTTGMCKTNAYIGSPLAREQSLRSKQRLWQFFTASWFVKPGRRRGVRHGILHKCPMWCIFGCKSREDSVRIGLELLSEAWLAHVPPVPVLNKWLKMFPIVSFSLFVFCFYRSPLLVWQTAIKRRNTLGARPHIEEHNLVGLGDESSFQRIQTLRYAKSTRFFLNPWTPRKLCVSVVILKLANNLLGFMFRPSVWSKSRSGIACLARGDSPISELTRQLISTLADERRSMDSSQRIGFAPWFSYAAPVDAIVIQFLDAFCSWSQDTGIGLLAIFSVDLVANFRFHTSLGRTATC